MNKTESKDIGNNIILLRPFHSITNRERDIIELVSIGYTEEEISKKLFIAISTVQTHKRNLLKKFQAKNSCQMVYQACKTNII